ncbi:hypothetical protein SVIOM74S_07852 [Streptomyces violarus]
MSGRGWLSGWVWITGRTRRIPPFNRAPVALPRASPRQARIISPSWRSCLPGKGVAGAHEPSGRGAAVDDQVGADHRTGRGRGEIEHRGRHFFGLRDPSERVFFTRSARSASVSPGRSDMGAADAPGLTALMRMPWWMWSRAAARVSAETAAFEAMYAAALGIRRCAPRLEEILTMVPPPFSFMCAISCFMASQTPVTLVRSTASHSSSLTSPTGTVPLSIPALLTAMSSPPKRVTLSHTRFWSRPESVTSAVTAAAVPPAASMRPTVSSRGAAVRPATTTDAPSAANASAIARPRPEPAPVTRTVLPVKRFISVAPLSDGLLGAVVQEGD